MKKALLLLIFGLLPVWVLLLLLAMSAVLQSNPGIHFAPWLIVAVLLCSVLTLTLTVYAVRRPPPEDSSSRFRDEN